MSTLTPEEIYKKWKTGMKQIDIAKEADCSESYISQVLGPYKKVQKFDPNSILIPQIAINQYPDIVYIALKFYKKRWLKQKPKRPGKMLDEWNKIEKILKTETF